MRVAGIVAAVTAVALAVLPMRAAAAGIATSTKLTSSVNPSVVGESVTFTATAANPASTTVTTVYGQAGSYSTAGSGTTVTTLRGAHNTLVDGSGDVYVADEGNHRILYFPSGSTTPTRVYGQGGSFNTGTSNKGGVSASSLYFPHGMALDSPGDLYVADRDNNRVLYFPAGSTTATKVWGQASFTTAGFGTTAATLDYPLGVALDASGDLYVADARNNRVLYFPAGSTTATAVYGQGGSFTTGTQNKGGVSASSLYRLEALGLGANNALYVADTYNNRVLSFAAGSTTATGVWGQSGSFTTANQGTSATALYHANGVVLDASNDLYVSDGSNHRILFFPTGSTTATAVYGPAGSFTTGTANNGGVSANSLMYPHGLSVGPDGTLYTADHDNNRVLAYPLVVPTGTVTFTDNGTAMGTVTLSGRTATLTTSSLTAGVHAITASYSGDSTFAASTTTVSQAVDLAVLPVPATGAVDGSVGAVEIGGGSLLVLVGLMTLLAAGRRWRRPTSE
jgi:hypothetical protein